MFDRRGFIKFAAGVAAGTLATPVIWQGLDDISIWTQNWSWIPRLDKGNNLNTYVRTTSKLCPSATGLKVRLVDGRPVRVLGDDDHPLSLGGVSALAIAEVQLRYSPARLKRPLKRAPDGTLVAISWPEAQAILAEKMGAARGADGLVCVSGDENGSINELLSGITAGLGSSNFYVMPSEAQPTAAAWKLMGGEGRIGYDLPNSDFVLAIGADVLETWGPVVGNRRAWGNARPQDAEPAMRLVYAGPVQNSTATGADLWLPIRPNTELALSLGLAHLLLASGKCSITPSMQPLTNLAAEWTPEKTAAATGLSVERLTQAAEGLLKARSPLVIAGSGLGQGGGAAPVMMAVALNVLLGRLNKDGGLRVLPVSPSVVKGGLDASAIFDKDFTAFAANVAKDSTPGGKTLLFYEANPVYAMPVAEHMDALFEKAEFSISFSCFLDETASRCDLVLPSALGLERMDDVSYPFGVGEAVYALARPVDKPLFEARTAGDVLLDAGRAIGLDFGFATMEPFYKAKAAQARADWNKLMAGECHTSRETLPVRSLHLPVESIAKAVADVKSEDLAVAVVCKRALGTSRTAIPPFNTKTISLEELSANSLVAAMNSGTAKKLALRNGQKVHVSNSAGSLTARVGFHEGVTNDTVALTAGFGHTAFGPFNKGKGENVMRLFTAATEPETGLGVWLCPGVKIVKA